MQDNTLHYNTRQGKTIANQVKPMTITKQDKTKHGKTITI